MVCPCNELSVFIVCHDAVNQRICENVHIYEGHLLETLSFKHLALLLPHVFDAVAEQNQWSFNGK